MRTELEGKVWRLSLAGPRYAGLHYAGPADFVLQEGRVMSWRRLPGAAPHGSPHHCFENALAFAAVNGLPYVEGFAQIDDQDAWNLDRRGRVLDVTWDERRYAWARCEGRYYVGVRFSVLRALDAQRYGSGSVLADEIRGCPVLEAPWPGERRESWRFVDGSPDRGKG